MTTNTGPSRSGRVGPLTIAALVLAIVLPPVGFVLGFFAARRESNVGYLAVFLGLVASILGYTAGIALLGPLLAPEGSPASNPIIGFTVALVVLAVVSVVGSLLWAKFTTKHDPGQGNASGYPQQSDR